MRRALMFVLLAGAAGCGFKAAGKPDAGGGTDGPPIDGSGFCYGSGSGLRICVPQAPTGSYTVSSDTMFHTDTDCTAIVTPDGGGPPLCVKAAGSIAISALLDVSGPNPLVLLATSTLDVSGRIDVASHRGQKVGPGANPAVCKLSTAGASSDTGAGGGAGGSFTTRGGNGGAGDMGATMRGTAGDPTGDLSALRGGCKGGNGGAGGGTAIGGPAGDGGGAVYLLSSGNLNLPGGTINASGAGGSPSPMPSTGNGGGGGGGGSGGMIALFARGTINASGAKIFANGAGGSEGGDKPHLCEPGKETADLAPLSGGLAGLGMCGAGGDGGGGAGAASIVADGSQGNEGGGGGGGGRGAVIVVSGQSLTGASVSP